LSYGSTFAVRRTCTFFNRLQWRCIHLTTHRRSGSRPTLKAPQTITSSLSPEVPIPQLARLALLAVRCLSAPARATMIAPPAVTDVTKGNDLGTAQFQRARRRYGSWLSPFLYRVTESSFGTIAPVGSRSRCGAQGRLNTPRPVSVLCTSRYLRRIDADSAFPCISLAIEHRDHRLGLAKFSA